jgi:hypothetical protein
VVHLLAALIVTFAMQAAISGNWIVEPRAPQCLGGAGASGQGGGCRDGGGAKVFCGEALAIKVSGALIQVERVVNGEKLAMAFPLDGSPVRHAIPICRELRQNDAMAAERSILMERLAQSGFDKMTTRASRDGARIVIRSSFGTATSTSERTQVLSLSTLGHLVVETESTLNGVKARPERAVYARQGGR